MTGFWLFLGAVLTLLGTPGPTNTLLYAAGALRGIRGSVLVLLVAELGGYLIATSAIAFVLGPLLAEHAVVAAIVKTVLAFYVALIGFRLWRAASVRMRSAQDVSFAMVFVTTLLNPKAIVFALVIIPFHTPLALPYLAAFSLCIPLVGFGWIMLGTFSGAVAAGRYRIYAVRVASVALWVFAGLILTVSIR